MDLGLRDRVYIVSGASAGLGLASARCLVDDGAKVVVCSRDEARIRAAADGLGGAEVAVGLVADLGDADSADRLIETALDRFGRLDGGILSVGGPPAGSVTDMSDEAWRTSFETVFLGPLRLARGILGGGTDRVVTFILSTSVKAPIANLGISNGLRPALAGAAKTLADEYGPKGNRVTMVMPGRIDTDRIRELESDAEDPEALRRSIKATIPLRRYGEAPELGRVAAFLTSPAASFVSGVAVAVDGGMTRAL